MVASSEGQRPAPAGLLIDANNAGRRVDTVLRQVCPNVGLGLLMGWVRRGFVRVNGKKTTAKTRLAGGDTLSWPRGADTPPVEGSSLGLPRPAPLDAALVVYEDDDILVVDKPAPWVCHSGTGHLGDSLADRVVAYLGAREAAVGHRPGLAQRLDRGVSGLVPIGKHARALRAMAAAVEDKSLQKHYVAWVAGHILKDQGSVTLALRMDDEPMGNRPRVHPDPLGKPAITHYQVRHRQSRASLVALRLETGRTHQIRAHMRALGHPLIGDPRYGLEDVNAYFLQTYGINRPLLHADKLTMRQPLSGAPLHLTAPMPQDMQRLMAQRRLV